MKTLQFRQPSKADILLAKKIIKKLKKGKSVIELSPLDSLVTIVDLSFSPIFKKAKVRSVYLLKKTLLPYSEGYLIPAHKDKQVDREEAHSFLAKCMVAEETKNSGNYFDRGLYAKTHPLPKSETESKVVFELKIFREAPAGSPINYMAESIVLCDETGEILPTKFAALFAPGWDENSPEAFALLEKNNSKIENCRLR